MKTPDQWVAHVRATEGRTPSKGDQWDYTFKFRQHVMRAASRPGDPDQLDMFLDYLAGCDRVEEIPLTEHAAAFRREWRTV